MELAKFSAQLGGKDPSGPPYRIPARDLDANFSKLKPLPQDGNNRQYAIDETPEGWRLKLFPDQKTNVASAVALLDGLQLVEVERCDGKKMMVLGTGWYD